MPTDTDDTPDHESGDAERTVVEEEHDATTTTVEPAEPEDG